MRSRAAGWIAIALASSWAVPAAAQQSWSVEDDSAVARMPTAEAGGVTFRGKLACAEQRWAMTLSREPAGDGISDIVGAARLSVGRRSFEARARTTGDGLEIAVPFEALEPLKAGLRLTVAAAGGEEIVFSLRGSRRAITAAEERCSERSLPAENRVIFTPYSSYLRLARELRKGAIRAFRAATSSSPEIAAAMAPLHGGRKLLFVELCGSSWYFGQTGCNIAAFARTSEPDEWRQVLDWEGAAVYLDRENTVEGWPGITVLPAKGPGEELRLSWDGEAYAVMDAVGDTADAGE